MSKNKYRPPTKNMCRAPILIQYFFILQVTMIVKLSKRQLTTIYPNILISLYLYLFTMLDKCPYLSVQQYRVLFEFIATSLVCFLFFGFFWVFFFWGGGLTIYSHQARIMWFFQRWAPPLPLAITNLYLLHCFVNQMLLGHWRNQTLIPCPHSSLLFNSFWPSVNQEGRDVTA